MTIFTQILDENIFLECKVFTETKVTSCSCSYWVLKTSVVSGVGEISGLERIGKLLILFIYCNLWWTGNTIGKWSYSTWWMLLVDVKKDPTRSSNFFPVLGTKNFTVTFTTPFSLSLSLSLSLPLEAMTFRWLVNFSITLLPLELTFTEWSFPKSTTDTSKWLESNVPDCPTFILSLSLSFSRWLIHSLLLWHFGYELCDSKSTAARHRRRIFLWFIVSLSLSLSLSLSFACPAVHLLYPCLLLVFCWFYCPGYFVSVIR